jgi:hypothetical protein
MLPMLVLSFLLKWNNYSFMPNTNIVCNDNKACLDCSTSSTTKGLRHIQMKDNRVRENIAKHFVVIHHVSGRSI